MDRYDPKTKGLSVLIVGMASRGCVEVTLRVSKKLEVIEVSEVTITFLRPNEFLTLVSMVQFLSVRPFFVCTESQKSDSDISLRNRTWQ